MKRPDPARLIDIVERADRIAEMLTSQTIERFINDADFREALLYNLIVIGEAVVNVSEEMKSKYTDIPWTDIRAFRNYVVHEYFETNFKVIWDAASVETPKLRASVIKIFKTDFPDLLEYLPHEEP